MSLKKIAIIGPESTGKSTLSEDLANHFNTLWVPEYARQYLENLGREYEEADLLEIAKGQVALERRLESEANGFLVCDTTLVVIKVWSEHKYGRCHPWILTRLEQMKYDYFLLTDIDLPWEPDPLREHPEMRQYFFEQYHQYLETNTFSYKCISGTRSKRLKLAVKAIADI